MVFGSRIDVFVARVVPFRDMEVSDIMPLTTTIKNYKFTKFDFMDDTEKEMLNYCDSLSCLHAMEYFGLGRYNDGLDYEG